MNLDLNINDFDSINSFWKFITEQNDWYLTYSPDKIKGIDMYLCDLEALIINETNELRKRMEFTYDDYRKIMVWDNFLIRADMDESIKFKRKKLINFKQFCANCKKGCRYRQRYPKAICAQCRNKITDKKGRKVEFFNTEILGYGCQGYYLKTEQKEKYDSELCYIDGKEYSAKEARFGGIVIQLEE